MPGKKAEARRMRAIRHLSFAEHLKGIAWTHGKAAGRKVPVVARLAFVALLTCFLSLFTFLSVSVPAPQDEFAARRRTMVERDLKGRGIRDPRVLGAMARIERHLFVDRDLVHRAYDDNPLPIGEGQTISQPYVVALMTEALELKPTDRVLEIGTGSGYQAAVLAGIAGEVYTIEIRKTLAGRAEGLLKSLGYRNILVKYGDGYFGWDEYAPFDAIIVTAAANHIPVPLIKQLKEGGRLIIPLGSTVYTQVLTLATKRKGELTLQQMGGVAFVPMTGEVKRRR